MYADDVVQVEEDMEEKLTMMMECEEGMQIEIFNFHDIVNIYLYANGANYGVDVVEMEEYFW